MISWIRKHKKGLLLAGHLLAVPAALFLRYLSEQMLKTSTICPWQRLGAKCPTCGGTHFVNALFSGNLSAALEHNAFLFLLTLFLGVSLVFVDLAVLFDLTFAKKALQKMYTIPVLIIFGVLLVLFLILRNWHIWLLPFQ